MATITGNEAKLAIVKATTWGTAVSAGSGDLAQVNSYEVTENVSELDGNALGAGLGMKSDVLRGNITHEGSLEMVVGYKNKADVLLASFYGNPQTPTEQTVGEGDYKHVVYASTSLHNNGYVTLAEKVTSSASIEIPTAAISEITISHDEPTSELIMSCSFLGSDMDLTPVNTYTVLDAASVATQTKTIVRRSSYWMINSQSGGALSTSTDLICPTSAEFTLSRAMVIRNTPCNSSASPVPGSDGFFEGTLTLTLPALDALTYFTGAQAESSYKAQFHVEGAQIGSGVNLSYTFNFPRLLLKNAPSRSLSEAGDNPVTLEFHILGASANPTGMTSTRPYYELVNTRTTIY